MLYIGGFTQKPYHVGYQVLKTKVNTELALEVKKGNSEPTFIGIATPNTRLSKPSANTGFYPIALNEFWKCLTKQSRSGLSRATSLKNQNFLTLREL